ncbi:tRNA pseudouridine(38-40) synthase TruA ['Fragaria x ananassa' phyllody phytoplasma]|uniref:tRNA pseudouridine synthase A n=1 Tax='Fragaria x ananassa' phyllody phytoplasma TaxID=2358428 RepID=A0ABS5K3H6_9MOLU|nr:tRNA pseudouridine(38-40) synthase TruA ['Fragaria x ananassa' phyllody phytoplasma]MBS2126329.1 tRNA pseudouridine(38-40) synthase TruA ['Fragaria x ananassa' phyllody phytoplasma]
MQYFCYKLILSYDGTCYCGYQKQPQVATIQQTLENALKLMTHQNIDTFAASRTDKGVHARGQIVHFKTPFFIEPKCFKNTLNHLLPQDIQVKKMQTISSTFHSRYLAKSKVYQYFFSKQPLNAFNCRFQVFIPDLDFDKIKLALYLIQGQHDFTSFTNEKQSKNFYKTIFYTFMKETAQQYILFFHGDSFLKYMVRFLLGSFIEIGKNRMSLDLFQVMLLRQTHIKATLLAPAKGLFLKKIFY